VVSLSGTALVVNERGAGRARRWYDMMRLLWELVKASPLAAVALAATLLVGNCALGAMAAATGGFVDAAHAASTGHSPAYGMVFWLGVYVAASAVENFYWNVKNLAAGSVIEKGVYRLQQQVLHRAAAVPLMRYEEATFFDLLQRASGRLSERVGSFVYHIIDQVQLAVMLGSVAAVLAAIQPVLLPLLCAGAAPALWLKSRTARGIYDAERAHTRDDRLRAHLEALLTGREAAAEIRLFGSAGYLLNRWRTLRSARSGDVRRAERRKIASTTGGSLLSGLTYAGGLVLLAALVLHGRLTVGNYVTVAVGALQFEQLLGVSFDHFGGFEEHSLFLADLFAFLRTARGENTPAAIEAPVADFTAERRPPRGVEIEADGITFAYPGSERRALGPVSLRIRRGEHVAIVGENGSGKTTLVKLLAGLYEPQEGAVRIDGISATAARARIAAVFQDYARFELTLRENVGLGDLQHIGHDAAIAAALRRADLEELAARLPEGLDGYLGRRFGETELSGGEWQRLALARAFFREADLLLLDEPTAALDPLAELALFTRFAELAAGRTAMMVSHRLGAVRHCDRILVLRNGLIVEEGRHQELLARNGVYAELFRAQARWYTALDVQ
jgi:ATP-binding cassette subfamily B protein